MAKKVVATLKSGKGKDFTKVIKMVKSNKTGSYFFKEEIVHKDHVEDLIEKATKEKNPLHAMQYTQAALNAANAMRVLVDKKEAEKRG